ncbi:MAG: hypothetical protein ACKO5P_03270 [Nodosilinea sp.]
MASDSRDDCRLERLRLILMRRWWLATALLWLILGSLSLISLRREIGQLHQYFTWTALRYALAYNRLAALGLGLCIGLSLALLLAESRYILFGLSRGERRRLQQSLERVRQRGPGHPLWRHLNL